MSVTDCLKLRHFSIGSDSPYGTGLTVFRVALEGLDFLTFVHMTRYVMSSADCLRVRRTVLHEKHARKY